jgi:hypothetical protein
MFTVITLTYGKFRVDAELELRTSYSPAQVRDEFLKACLKYCRPFAPDATDLTFELVINVFLPDGSLFEGGTLGDFFDVHPQCARLLWVMGFYESESVPDAVVDFEAPGTWPAARASLPANLEMNAFLVYFAKNGYRTREAFNAWAHFLPFAPFVASFGRIVNSEKVLQRDISIVRESIRGFIKRHSVEPVKWSTAFFQFGKLTSLLVSEASGDPVDIWSVPEHKNPELPSESGQSDVFRAVEGWEAHRRTVATVVRIPDGCWLLLGRSDNVLSIVHDLRTGETSEREVRHCFQGIRFAPAGVRQLTVVLLDTTGSMRGYSRTLRTRKLDAALALLRAYGAAESEQGVATLFGFGTTKNPAVLDFSLVSPRAAGVGKAAGKTDLFGAIAQVARAVREFGGQKRILVFTDGRDGPDGPESRDRAPLTADLVAWEVVVDAIGVGEWAEFSEELRVLCAKTNGISRVAESLDWGREYVAKEVFVDLAVREVYRAASGDALWLKPDAWALVPIHTERTGDSRKDRIATEIEMLWTNGFPVWQVVHVETWLVLVKQNDGRLGELSVTFPWDYPFAEPVCRFRTRTGPRRVRQRGIYHPRDTVVDMIGRLGECDGEIVAWETVGEFAEHSGFESFEAPDTPQTRESSSVRYSPITWEPE